MSRDSTHLGAAMMWENKMPDFHNDLKITIRRKGVVATAGVYGCDAYCAIWHEQDKVRNDLHYGDRRDRQIAKRHWLSKVDKFWSVGGGGCDNLSTKKSTQGKEVFLKRKEL